MDRDPTDSEGTKMLRLATEQGLLHLTADLLQRDSRPSQTRPKTSSGLFGAQVQRFPPIEDVVAALDRVASHAKAG